MGLSLMEHLAQLPVEQRDAFLKSTTPEEQAAAHWDWRNWGRPEQQEPLGEWLVWLVEAGRGFGKTRTGAEWINAMALAHPGCRIALGGKQPDDYRETMACGEAGLIESAPPWRDERTGLFTHRPTYHPGRTLVTWPNGSQATCFSGEAPEDLRGPAHHFFWIDELCKFKHPERFLANLMLGMRLGDRPRGIITTTPKPLPAYIKLRKQATTVITGGSTYENLSNLAGTFKAQVLSQYEGTRLGRQELHAELLLDVPGALWKRERLDLLRVDGAPVYARIAIGVDPAATSGETANETGICVGGVDERRHGYLLEDCSGHYTPGQWGDMVVRKFVQYGANEVIAEANQGGEMVRHTIVTAAEKLSLELGKELIVPIKLVHASHGKVARAEPIAALDEQGRLHHVGTFGQLEDQLCTWLPGEKSPDRLDAYVWLMWGLILESQPAIQLFGGGAVDVVKPVVRGQQELDPDIAAALSAGGVHFPGR